MKLFAAATVLSVVFSTAAANAYDMGPGFGARYGATGESPIVGKGTFHVLRNGENGQPKQTATANPGIQDDTIYVVAGTAIRIHTQKPFKSVHIGDDALLTITAVSDHDLIITANRSDDALIANASVLLLDDQGSVVEDLHVEVTPFNGPSAAVAVHEWRRKPKDELRTTNYRCGNIAGGCINTEPRDTGPDGVSVTKWSDGSSSTTQSWHK